MKPDLVKRTIVDGDIVAYRCAFSTEGKPLQKLHEKIDSFMGYILDSTLDFSNGDDFPVYITGSGNFRFDYGVTYPYKGNRSPGAAPRYLPTARQYLMDNYSAVMSHGEEADDLIAIDATKHDSETTVVASIDKDMKQIPCWHYNFVTGDWHKTEPFGGLVFFYTQILTGDNVDNIKGLHRVGPKKAAKILEGKKDELSLYNACIEAYDGNVDRVIENARLLWLRRYEGQIWEPPTERKEDE